VPKGLDPIRLEVFHHLFAAVCEQAGAVLQRGAASPNVRERRDFSVALFDPEGRLVAQAAHIPVHLGSAGDSVAAVRRELDLEPGATAVLNDPYRGGTHLPDVTMVRALPVTRGGAPWYGVARAHHADIGGAVPGSMGVAEDLVAEGLVIPPILWREANGDERATRDVRALVFANVRGSRERAIDFAAQEASLASMEAQLVALCREQGGERAILDAAHALMDYSESVARSVVRSLPAGRFEAVDELEDDGYGNGPFPIRLVLERTRGRGASDALRFSWQAPPAARGGINANRGIVTAACVYVLRCACPDRLPTNEGVFRVVDIVTTSGSLLDPEPPSPVAGGNVETSQRLVDLGLEALALARPDLAPAGSAGTMTNLTLGTPAGALYETLPGGAGAGPHGPGASCVQTHMTNTRNTPVEELERTTPLLVRSLTVERGSGGAGARRGGDGLRKEVEARAAITASLFAERRRRGGRGVAGGSDGAPGGADVRPADGGPARPVPAKGTVRLERGDVLCVRTPGGGGHGAKGHGAKGHRAKKKGHGAATTGAGSALESDAPQRDAGARRGGRSAAPSRAGRRLRGRE
jgi:N-methylhydantoinase B